MQKNYIIIAALVFLLLSCRKKRELAPVEEPLVNRELKAGWPEDIRAVNGYFYASRKTNYDDPQYSNVTLYAVFRDPAGDLCSNFDHYELTMFPNFQALGNVKVGSVYFGSETLLPSELGMGISYAMNLEFPTPMLPATASWQTDGNGSFKPVNIKVGRGFPHVSDSAVSSIQNYSLSISRGFTLNLGSSVSNFDSLVVTLNTFTSKVVRKTLNPGENVVYFSSDDLSALANQSASGRLSLNAFNYSNMIIENKTYLFELSNKLQVNMMIWP